MTILKNWHSTVSHIKQNYLFSSTFSNVEPNCSGIFCTAKRRGYFYRPQRSWAKVIFSQACVKNSVHGGEGVCLSATPPGPGTHPREQTPPRTRHTPPGKQTVAYGQQAASTHPTGMHSFIFCFLAKTRMHSNRMRSVHCSGRLSCHACPPTMQAPPPPRMPPATHAPPPPQWTDRHLWKYYLRKLRLRAVASAGVIGKVAEAGGKVNRKEESLGVILWNVLRGNGTVLQCKYSC